MPSWSKSNTNLYFNSIWIKVFLLWLLVNVNFVNVIAQNNIITDIVVFKKKKATIYQHFHEITQQTGYFFIYNNRLVNNNRRVTFKKKKLSVDDAIKTILQNSELTYRVINNHILIYSKSNFQRLHKITIDTSNYVIINGRVVDSQTNKPLQFATVGVTNKDIGVITNKDGFFRLRIDKKDTISKISFSHVGYKMQEVLLENLNNHSFNVFLQPHTISLQEVLVRYIDPKYLLNKAILERESNYPTKSYNQQAFYREGVLKNEKIINYTESIFNLYKTPFTQRESKDRVKLIKWRKLYSKLKKDTIEVKMKAGVKSILELDIIKYLPDFLDLHSIQNYEYKYAGITTFYDKEVYAVQFNPDENSPQQYYSGFIYIDPQNYAILGCEFEVESKQLKKNQSLFLVKKSGKIKVNFSQIKYNISYKPIDSLYYINHIRCDIMLNTKNKYGLKKSNFHTFIEFASLSITTEKVKKYKYRESVRQNSIFGDKVFQYDAKFWKDYNYISPEQNLTDAIENFAIDIITDNDKSKHNHEE